MSRHFEQADGLCENRDPATEGFVFNQTMLRIKSPEKTLDFYTRVMGMTLVKKLDFPEMKFSLYFLAWAIGRPIQRNARCRPLAVRRCSS